METPNCYLEFDFPDETTFYDLKTVFDKFKEARDNYSELYDHYWLEAFPEYAISQFWFLDTDIKPLHATVVRTENSWHFYSLVEALYKNYEVDFVGLRKLSPNTGILEYMPYSYPYGGTGGFIALLKSFDCIPTIVDDGTGLYKIVFNTDGTYDFKDFNV
ncbi:hypothetical protein [Flavobacterium sp.]|uniref:hypothetical protein n=1 Tax=Flavobacterium sp. TaxID=239 RepID=UPI00260C989C|nr:hypothetical protein [Flavobacterium sp.]